MKPYGVKPSSHLIEGFGLDIIDCRDRGAPSRFHKIRSKTRQAARRRWAKYARHEGKKMIKEMLT